MRRFESGTTPTSRKPMSGKVVIDASNNVRLAKFNGHICFLNSEGQGKTPSLKRSTTNTSKPEEDRVPTFSSINNLFTIILRDYQSELLHHLSPSSYQAISRILELKWRLAYSEEEGSLLGWAKLDLPSLSTDDVHHFAQRLVEPLCNHLGLRYGIYTIPNSEFHGVYFCIPGINKLSQNNLTRAENNFRNNRCFYLSWEPPTGIQATIYMSSRKHTEFNAELFSQTIEQDNKRAVTDSYIHSDNLRSSSSYRYNANSLPPASKDLTVSGHARALQSPRAQYAAVIFEALLFDMAREYKISNVIFSELLPLDLICSSIRRDASGLIASNKVDPTSKLHVFKMPSSAFMEIFNAGMYFGELIAYILERLHLLHISLGMRMDRSSTNELYFTGRIYFKNKFPPEANMARLCGFTNSQGENIRVIIVNDNILSINLTVCLENHLSFEQVYKMIENILHVFPANLKTSSPEGAHSTEDTHRVGVSP